MKALWVCCLLAGVAYAQPAKKAGKRDLSAEITALNGADYEAAARAADALGASTDPAAHDALIDALAMGLPAAVTANAFVALAKRPAPLDVKTLARYATHHAPVVRANAIAALATYPGPPAKAAVVAGLHDPIASVRKAAAEAAGKGHVRSAFDALVALLAKGEEPAARALAAMADTELARKVADQFGKVPEASLALTLGLIIKRPDFGPDNVRVEIVRAIAKIQDKSAVAALQDYVDSIPKKEQRPSKQEAQGVIDGRTK
jgi:HEAT repeat protein